MNEVMTDEEKEGVKAIIYLQKAVGIDESEADALAGWRAFSPQEKRQTAQTYNVMRKKESA